VGGAAATLTRAPLLTRAWVDPPLPQVNGSPMDERQPLCAQECMSLPGIHADSRCYPSRRPSALQALRDRTPTYVTPAVGQPDTGFDVVLYPIFVNTTGARYNATFDRGIAVHDCPVDACFDSMPCDACRVSDGMRFWGMVEVAFSQASSR
jgi:hypothetical protein